VIQFQSDIAGKEAVYGEIKKPFAREGFTLCGDWEYDEASFDTILEREEGKTIYLRLPVRVVKGQLDDSKSHLTFGQPFLLRHEVYSSLRGQVQETLLPSGNIHEKNLRIKKARQAIERIMHYLH
jgi:hypothetical protein